MNRYAPGEPKRVAAINTINTVTSLLHWRLADLFEDKTSWNNLMTHRRQRLIVLTS
jgi:hypothetical protein